MTDPSGQTFKYAGKKYTLQLQLEAGDQSKQVPLNTEAVECFEYETELNSFLVRGSVVYRDQYGQVDRLLEEPVVVCTAFFTENEQKFDGSVTLERFSETRRAEIRFLVDGIGITGRDGHAITYRIDLVSANILKCRQNVKYSNYGRGRENVFDIFKACLCGSGIAFDADSFELVKTPVRLGYVTNGNDDIFSVSKYLMGRLYYDVADYDDSMKFFYWNETAAKGGAVRLFDIKNSDTAAGESNVMLSLMKSNNEALIEQEPNNLGTITRFPAQDRIGTFFPAEVTHYDFDRNSFGTYGVSSQSLAGYFGRTSPGADQLVKQPVLDESGYGFLRRQAYWNNDINCYDRMVKALTKSNALLIETAGDIMRRPSSVVNVSVDRDMNELADDTHKDLDDLMTRYHGLEGVWFASRVHHVVYPKQSRYRQAVALCRNFRTDPDNKAS